jgi:hypothetical protein
MPFVDQLPSTPKSGFQPVIRRANHGNELKALRFSHEENSWQRMATFGHWLNVSVVLARMLRDQGFRIWGEE